MKVIDFITSDLGIAILMLAISITVLFNIENLLEILCYIYLGVLLIKIFVNKGE